MLALSSVHVKDIFAAKVVITDGSIITGRLLINTYGFIVLQNKFGTFKIGLDIIDSFSTDKNDAIYRRNVNEEKLKTTY